MFDAEGDADRVDALAIAGWVDDLGVRLILVDVSVERNDGGVVFRKIGLTAAMAIALTGWNIQAAQAMDTYDLGVMMAYETCLPTKVPGTFYLQTRSVGTATWKNQGSAKAWDDRGSEDSSCPTFATGVFWTPKQAGTFDIRLYNSTNHKTYKAATIAIAGSAPATNPQPAVQYVTMPNLVGMQAYQAGLSITGYGYHLGRWAIPSSTGYAPKISCQMNPGSIIVKQNPMAGSKVQNSVSTHVQVWVNCG